MRFLLTISLVVLLMFSHAMPATGEKATKYLCIPDLSTGFKREASGKWIIARFDVEGIKYLLFKKAGKWYWKEFGASIPDSAIKCGSFNENGFIKCEVIGTLYTFNKKTLRFNAVQPFGYVLSDIEAEKLNLTPYITIGTCSPL